MTVSLRDSAARILPLAWPVLVGQLAVLAFGTVDTVLVARASALDLAALAIGAAAYISVFIGLMGVVLAIGPINPHYVEGAGAGVNINCTSCANAVQGRLRGVDPHAVATKASGYGTENSLLPSAPFGFGAPTTVDRVRVEMLARGEGATHPLIIQQAGGEIEAGHPGLDVRVEVRQRLR